MTERLRGLATWVRAQPVIVKVVLAVMALVLAVLLSRVLVVLAALVFVMSLVGLLVGLVRRRGLKKWGIAAASSLAAVVVFTGIANAVHGPPEQPKQQQRNQEQASAPEAATEEQAPEATQEAVRKIIQEEPKVTEEVVAAKQDTQEEPKATEGVAAAKQESGTETSSSKSSGGSFDETVRVTRVVDGDTVDISPAVEGATRVRFIGLDTPEMRDPECGKQPYADEAKRFTESELQGEEVELELDVEKKDRNGRLLAYVYEDGKMFNETLLREGYAQVATFPPNVKYVDRFLSAQEEARTAGWGLWGLSAEELAAQTDRGNGIGGSVCPQQAQPKTPKSQPQPPPASGSSAPLPDGSCPSGSPIKGNASSGIYHAPGGQFYGKTKAEECFASASEAEAAGYRKSKR